MPNALQAQGSTGRKQTAAAPIFVNEMFTGLWTQGNPLRERAVAQLIQKFYQGTRNDGLLDGRNVEITNRLTLARRCGASVYNSATFAPIQRFYEFRQNYGSGETISVIADTAATIYDATGPSNQTTIWTKSPGSVQSSFQSVGNVLYFSDGVDAQKYYLLGSSFVTQNWGIALGSGTNGPNTAGAGASVGLGQDWVNPGNVSSATNFTTVLLIARSQQLQATDFGFSLAAGLPITGITVTFNAKVNETVTENISLKVQLLINGVPVSDPFGHIVHINTLTTSAQSITLGSARDLWNAKNLSAAQVNASNFGVSFTTPGGGSGIEEVEINNVQITVGNGLIPQPMPGGSGSYEAVNGGYEYEICYQNNTVTPPVDSSPSLPSLRTGNFSGKAYISVPLVASTDPQVTGIQVFRTTDGGATFSEIPTSPYPNTTQTIEDTALNTSGSVAGDQSLNIFSSPPAQQENNPPPVGLTNLCYHLGRIIGSVGTTMYISDGPDNPYNGNEAFPPLNNYVLPSTIQRFVPLTIGLLIYTTSGVYFSPNAGANGDYPGAPAAWMQGKVGGLMSYNALDVVGSTMYLVNSKAMCKAIDISAGESEVGFPIGDVLAGNSQVPVLAGVASGGINPAAVYVSYHEQNSTDTGLYLASPGAAGGAWWLRMNATPAPEQGLAWSPPAVSAQGYSAVQSIETSPGIHQLLMGPPPGGGPILFRDPTTNADNGTTYAAYADIGALVLAFGGQAALIYHITTDCIAVGSHPTISVLMQNLGGHLNVEAYGRELTIATGDPPQLGPANQPTVYNDRWWMSATQEPAYCRYMTIEIAWPAENFPNELLTYTLFGEHYQEI